LPPWFILYGNLIIPNGESYVYSYAEINLRNLLYNIESGEFLKLGILNRLQKPDRQYDHKVDRYRSAKELPHFVGFPEGNA
jgi:hypothetical protein